MSETNDDGAAAPQTADAGNVQVQVAVQRLYVKDLSFESPNSPDIFRAQWKPKIKLDINSRFVGVETNLFEVVLTLSVEARGEDDRVGFIAEIQQAGIFRIEGVPNERLQQVLATWCPNTLFPYGREALDSLVTRGGFPALMLAPVNFDAIYAQAMKEHAEKVAKEAAGEGDVTH